MVIQKVNIPAYPMGPAIGEIASPIPASLPRTLYFIWGFMDRMRRLFSQELAATGKNHSNALIECAIKEITEQKKRTRR